jgi:hypothetical protein
MRAPIQLFGLWSVCSKIDVISVLLRVKPPPHASSDFLESVCEEGERERFSGYSSFFEPMKNGSVFFAPCKKKP